MAEVAAILKSIETLTKALVDSQAKQSTDAATLQETRKKLDMSWADMLDDEAEDAEDEGFAS